MAKAKTAKAVKAVKVPKVPETVYISEADQYLFAQGTHYDIYKKLGAHQSVEDGKKGMSFAVWAPHAASVFVIGTFNSWNETANQLEKLGELPTCSPVKCLTYRLWEPMPTAGS